MTRLTWNRPGSRRYEAGVDRGVLYPKVGPGVPWNGLLAVREVVKAQATNVQHVDGLKYNNRLRTDSFEGSIEAFTYPEEFDPALFDFSYRTMAGTDLNPDRYKIHLVYNASATPLEREYRTYQGGVDLSTFGWNYTTRPIALPGFRGSAHYIIDSTLTHKNTLAAIENLLYGSEDGPPQIPTPAEVVEIFEQGTTLRITDHGDGTWTAEGPDSAIKLFAEGLFEITWPSAIFIDETTYTISSL